MYITLLGLGRAREAFVGAIRKWQKKKRGGGAKGRGPIWIEMCVCVRERERETPVCREM